MSDIILSIGHILIDTGDIQTLYGLEYQGKPKDELSGKFVMRIIGKTPRIGIVYNFLTETQRTYKNILKSCHVIGINEMRYGK